MLDRYIRPMIDPPLNAVGALLSAHGVTANAVTLSGLMIGLLSAVAISLGWFAMGLALILLSRLADGLDGAVARASTFYFNGASFLGYAILAERHDIQTDAQGVKSLYYSNGILEGTETIAFFILLCLFPSAFAALSYFFAILCFATGALRVYGAAKVFS